MAIQEGRRLGTHTVELPGRDFDPFIQYLPGVYFSLGDVPQCPVQEHQFVKRAEPAGDGVVGPHVIFFGHGIIFVAFVVFSHSQEHPVVEIEQDGLFVDVVAVPAFAQEREILRVGAEEQSFVSQYGIAGAVGVEDVLVVGDGAGADGIELPVGVIPPSQVETSPYKQAEGRKGGHDAECFPAR